jgi:hypothetical protein
MRKVNMNRISSRSQAGGGRLAVKKAGSAHLANSVVFRKINDTYYADTRINYDGYSLESLTRRHAQVGQYLQSKGILKDFFKFSDKGIEVLKKAVAPYNGNEPHSALRVTECLLGLPPKAMTVEIMTKFSKKVDNNLIRQVFQVYQDAMADLTRMIMIENLLSVKTLEGMLKKQLS